MNMELIREKVAQLNVLVDELDALMDEETTKETTKETAEETAEETVEKNIVTLDDGEGNISSYELDDMNLKDLKAFAEDCGIKLTAKKRDDIIVEIMAWANEEESEEEPDTATLYGLNDMDVEQLASILADAEMSVKGKKQALIDRIVTAIEAGELNLDIEDEPAEDQNVEDEPENEAMAEAEEAVDKKIRAEFKSGKLKLSTIKDFMKKYFEGDPECGECPKSCEKDAVLECYIGIHKELVDDEGNVSPMEEAYVRNGENYCCGKPIDEIDGKLYCSVCDSTYEG